MPPGTTKAPLRRDFRFSAARAGGMNEVTTAPKRSCPAGPEHAGSRSVPRRRGARAPRQKQGADPTGIRGPDEETASRPCARFRPDASAQAPVRRAPAADEWRAWVGPEPAATAVGYQAVAVAWSPSPCKSTAGAARIAAARLFGTSHEQLRPKRPAPWSRSGPGGRAGLDRDRARRAAARSASLEAPAPCSSRSNKQPFERVTPDRRFRREAEILTRVPARRPQQH